MQQVNDRINKLILGFFVSLYVALSGCGERIPPPPPVVKVPADEKTVHDKILSLAGEVGERDSKTGQITIVTLQGKQVDDKALNELGLASLKKLEILELRSTSVTKKGFIALGKALPNLKMVRTKADP